MFPKKPLILAFSTFTESMKIHIILFFSLVCTLSLAQKKAIDHTVYNDWKSLKSAQVSNNGKFVTYEITPHRGDGYLYVYDKVAATLDSFPRGTKAKFSEESDYLIFTVTAGFDTLRQCELKKIDKKKWPKDSLYILRLDTKAKESFPMLKSVQTSPKGSWMAYTIDSIYAEPKKAAPKKSQWQQIFAKKKPAKKEVKISTTGQILFLYHPITEGCVQLNDVTEYMFSENGEYLLYVQHQKVDKVEKYNLSAYSLANEKTYALEKERTKIGNLATSKNDKFAAYLASSDTGEVVNSSLILYDLKAQKRYLSIDSTSSYIETGQAVSENQTLIFTENEKYLFLGISEASVKEPEDSLLVTEKAKLDVWHYEEKRNQPMQLRQLSRDQKETDLHVLHLDNFELIRLENDSLKTRPVSMVEGNYVLASNSLPYDGMSNWAFPTGEDHYRISLIDGSRELIRKNVRMGGDLSPSGERYTYFSYDTQQHYWVDMATGKETCISCQSKGINWQEDVNGQPHTPFPVGTIGWDRGEKNLFLHSEFDVWKYELGSGALTSITNEEGKTNNIEFRLRNWSFDSVYISPENNYLQGFDKKTKDAMVYQWMNHGDHSDMMKLYQTPHSIVQLGKSKNGEQYIMRKSNLQDYADLFLLDKNFKNEKRISLSNPQQDEYNWATVELIDYKSRDGQKLQALLYKPEDFDASKKYPMLVYFYELYTDELHNHYAPKPTASIIYPTEYASAGYVVLIPDIRYKAGYPAQSAYNCIMGSTDAALKLYPNIDSTRMGLQGQSWGGYQTAQLITMTTRYRAAMAGAPVSNMFSAYGGIRWGSGMNRQFQYERAQSRIGKTIWEAPQLYVENSPIFHLPRVKTPLLIMHNDEDGAVPWYQGIELFMGMKRLGKPCWMLNYNGDDHNLMKNANRIDLSIRMRQFFDHYLMGAPAPVWLTEGIPAIEKGEEYGLELTK
jgi:dienelactone hydrolase